MSEKNKVIAEMRLIQEDDDKKLNVETEIFLDGVVGPEDLITMFGFAVWDLLKKSQWGDMIPEAKEQGVTEDEWQKFEDNMDFIIAQELRQYLMAVIGALMVPGTFKKEGAVDRLREAIEWTSEYVAKAQEEETPNKEG
jgi:hypothetical protein